MYTQNKTIIICDRGYEGRNVCAGLIEMGYKFIIRAKSPKGCGILYGCSLKLPEGSNLAAANIKLYCKKDCTGQYKACKSSIDCRVLNLRVVMLRLANGDIEYLVTNLSRAVIFCIEYLFKRGTQDLEKKLQSNLTRIEKNRIFVRNTRRKSARSFNARPR